MNNYHFLRKTLLTGFLLATGAIVTACGGGGNDAGAATGTTPSGPAEQGNQQVVADNVDIYIPEDIDLADPLAAMNAVLANFPQSFSSADSAIEGGVLRVIEVSNNPASGVFGGAVFSSNNTDTSMISPAGTQASIFSYTPALAFSQTGLATWEADVENMILHIELQHQAYWHDGVPLTLDDLVFAYEIIAHPDYTGIRFTAPNQSIVGIMEYHRGEADYISGLVLSDDAMSLSIHFNDFPPTHLNAGIWTSPTPRHHFAGLSVADMPSSAQVRYDIIGWGPFIVDNIVPGESVSFVRNDNFVFGRPYLDGIIIEIVSPAVGPEAMAQGLFDIMEFPVDQFPYYQNPSNFTFVSSLSGIYNFTAFNLGYWDAAAGAVVPERDTPLQNVYLRRAMAYALDQEAITQNIFHGLRFPATSIVTPIHAEFLNTELQGYPFDVERANQILDDAGFTARDGDGYRLDLDGNEMTLIFGIHEAGPNDLIAQFYIQSWGNIGVRVELFEHRLLEFSSFMSAINEGEEWVDGIDLIFGNWVPGFNPNPSGRWGHETAANRSRFTTAESRRILEEMGSVAAWDSNFMRDRQFELQDWFQYYVPVMFNNWRIGLVAVNNRVINYNTDMTWIGQQGWYGSEGMQWHLIQLSADAPHTN